MRALSLWFNFNNLNSAVSPWDLGEAYFKRFHENIFKVDKINGFGSARHPSKALFHNW